MYTLVLVNSHLTQYFGQKVTICSENIHTNGQFYAALTIAITAQGVYSCKQ